MTDFDPDAYLQGSPSHGFDPDAYLGQSPVSISSTPAPASQPGFLQRGADRAKEMGNVALSHPFTVVPGLLENSISGITSGVGSLADALTGSQPGAHDWGYRPRTEAGKEIAGIGGQETHEIGQLYDRAFGTGPAATEIKSRIPEALGAISTATGLIRGGGAIANRFAPPAEVPAASGPPGLSNMDSPQSMGAAHAAPDLTNASEELKSAVTEAARRSGGAVNPEALGRQLEADSLPEPIRLTKGQALQDVQQLSREQNLRGSNPELAQRFNEQNGQLVRNLQSLRDQAGPDVFSTNPVEHGDTLIDAYKAKAAVAEADINAKYQALRDANGGQFPVDAPQLLQNVEGRLHQQLLYEHAPRALGQLQDMAENGMTMEQFEALRTNLARTMRSSTDGNEVAAARVIRDEMEKLPLQGAAQNLKPLADAARGAARAQFQALDADPAYKAAVNETIPPDRFTQKFVIGGTRDGIARMRATLADNDSAQQTITVAGLDHLRKSAGIDDMGNGNFSQAGYNKALQQLGPKRIFEPGLADHMEKLGNVARYTQMQPRGSFVNNSNTFTAAAAEHAKSAVEGAVNVAAKGVPIGTFARKALQNQQTGRFVRESLKPGAGVDELTERR